MLIHMIESFKESSFDNASAGVEHFTRAPGAARFSNTCSACASLFIARLCWVVMVASFIYINCPSSGSSIIDTTIGADVGTCIAPVGECTGATGFERDIGKCLQNSCEHPVLSRMLACVVQTSTGILFCNNIYELRARTLRTTEWRSWHIPESNVCMSGLTRRSSSSSSRTRGGLLTTFARSDAFEKKSFYGRTKARL